MTLFTNAQATALTLLTKYGEPATLRVESGSTFDPVTQTNVPGFADYPVRVYVGNYSGRLNEDGQLVQTNDRKLLVSGAGVTLEPGMSARVVVSGTNYASQNIKPIGGQGVQAIYVIQGRS